jgi:hypothetical protein
MATLDAWRVIDGNSLRPEINNSNYTSFALGSWGTFGESIILEIDFTDAGLFDGAQFDIDVFLFGTASSGATAPRLINVPTIGNNTSTSVYRGLDFIFERTGATTYTITLQWNLLADFNTWIGFIPPIDASFLFKNTVQNTLVNDNTAVSSYNTPLNFIFASALNGGSIEYFQIPFSAKYINQNFANTPPDINFDGYELFVGVNQVTQPSATLTTRVQATFISTTPITNAICRVFNHVPLNDDEYNVFEPSLLTIISLGNDLYRATWIITASNIDPFNQYRFIFIAYDTANDKFNSFPIDVWSDGDDSDLPSHTGKFTHNWGTPNNVAGGLNTDKIVTSVNQRIGSSLRIDRDVYDSLGIPSISPYFESFKVSDKDGNILRQWNRNQQIPIDSVGVLFGAQNIFAFVYRVPIAWDNSANEFKWELTYNFPFGTEIWEFTAEIEVNESDDNIVFKKPNGDALGVVCLDELPNFIIVETNDPAQANNDKQVATFEGGFEWYGVRDENSDITQVQNNSLPNTAFNWGIFAFDDPYIFDVTTSNGTVMSYKFRIKDYIDNFGINAVQNKFFGSILIK